MSTNPHRVALTLEEGRVAAVRGMCDDPLADCHYTCTRECESWAWPLIRDNDGTVWHAYVDDDGVGVRHRMEHLDGCTLVEWLANDTWPSESMEGVLELTVPAEIVYDAGNENVTWRPYIEED